MYKSTGQKESSFLAIFFFFTKKHSKKFAGNKNSSTFTTLFAQFVP